MVGPSRLTAQAVVTVALLSARAIAQSITPLAPVDVPLPAASELSPESPLSREPSSPVSVIDLTERRSEAKDAAEHLTSVPGAIISDVGGTGQRKTLSLRGASPNAVLVLLDGVPLTPPGESMDLSRIPAAALDRIEVLRGAGSRYGPGGMGGVVNLVTRGPDQALHVFGTASQGSFTTTALDVGASGELGPGQGLLLLHGLRSEGSFDFRYDATPEVVGSPSTLLPRDNNQALSGGALGRYRWQVGATQLDFLAEGALEQRGLAGPVQNPSPDARQQTTRGTLSARSATRFEHGGTLSLLAFGRLDSTELSGSVFSGTYRQLASSVGVEATYAQLLGRHGLSALLSTGGDWLREPSNTNPAWGRLGALVGDEVLFFDGRLSVNAAARVDVAGPFVVVSPKAGAALQLPLDLSLKVSAGQASRTPSFLELYVLQGTLLPNPTLRPERALTADATLELTRERYAVGVTGFASLYQDLISYEYYPPAMAKPFNFSAALVAGAEVEGRVHPVSWLDASVSYTYLHTQNLRDDPRYYLKELPFRPNHRLAARVQAGVPLAMARAELVFQSAQFMNRTETLSLPARALLTLGVSTRPFKHPAITVAFEVKNVLDVQTQDVDGYPLPPRAAYLTLGFAWDGAPQ